MTNKVSKLSFASRPYAWVVALLLSVIGLILWVGSMDRAETDGFTGCAITEAMGQPWLVKTFGEEELALMLHFGSQTERQIAKSVLAQAEQAFSALGLTKEEAEKTYGLLSRYTMHDMTDVQEQHSLKLISAQIKNDEGHMWIRYSQRGVDAHGNTVRGSSDIFSFWTIQKDADENWYVSNIKEPA